MKQKKKWLNTSRGRSRTPAGRFAGAASAPNGAAGNGHDRPAPSAEILSKRQSFLEGLAEGMSVSGAAQAAVVGYATVYQWRRQDQEFAALWEAALEVGTDKLEDEAYRRAYEGVDEPVYHGGVKVGVVRRYSDTLMMCLLKARRPHKYRERMALEHSTGEPMKERKHELISRILELAEKIARRAPGPDAAAPLPPPKLEGNQ